MDTETSNFWPDGKRAAVSLSFDDARVSQADHGLPILDRHGVLATFYIVPALAEKRGEAWKRAAATGHEIGNHTDSHPCSGNLPFTRHNALETYTFKRLEDDIDRATSFIRSEIGVMPRTFAFPCGHSFVGYGGTRASYVPLVAKKFLACRRAFDESHNHPAHIDLSQLFAMDMDGSSMQRIRALVEAAIDDRGYLILHGHDIGPGNVQTVHPDLLDEICRLLTDSKLPIWCDRISTIAAYVHDKRGF